MGQRVLHGLCWGVGGPLCRAIFSLQAGGLENLPQDRPYLIAANHTSLLDGPSILWAVRPHVERLTLAVAQDYFFRSVLLEFFFRTLMSAVPFDRYDHFQEGLIRIRSSLGTRRPLLVFPEGTRSLSGQLQPFKTGIGLLALELNLPIVPVHISGTYQVLPKGKRRPVPYPIKLLFGQSLEMKVYQHRRETLNSYEIYREIVENLRREIERLAEQNR